LSGIKDNIESLTHNGDLKMSEFQQIWIASKGTYKDECYFIKDALKDLNLNEHLDNFCEDLYELDRSRYIDLIRLKAKQAKNYDILERLWFYGMDYC
jgi:hypothetical protein